MALLWELLDWPYSTLYWQPSHGYFIWPLTGITCVAGTLIKYAATGRGWVSIVVSLIGLHPLMTILLALVFLHETLVVKQVAGLCCVVAAIVLRADNSVTARVYGKTR